eukprot:10315057-Prorocentrum_lima.AAC.1
MVIIRKVVRLRGQFGHPSPQALADHMAQAGYDVEYVRCVGAYKCSECLANQLPKEPCRNDAEGTVHKPHCP